MPPESVVGEVAAEEENEGNLRVVTDGVDALDLGNESPEFDSVNRNSTHRLENDCSQKQSVHEIF